MRNLSKIVLLSAFMSAFVVGCAAPQPQAPTSDGFAIQNVTVINIKTGEKSAGQTVLVRGNQISQVGAGAQVQVPAGMRIVDGQNRFLIPGIWDFHVHATRAPDRALTLLVARGVSDARDMGADITRVPQTRDLIAKGMIAPRLYIAGEGLEGVSGQRPGQPPNTVLDTPDKARAQIQKLAAVKVNFLKAHVGLPHDVFLAVMDESKKVGLPVDGHLQPGWTLITASDIGQRTIEHMVGWEQACAANPDEIRSKNDDAPPIKIDKAKCEETVKHLAKNGTWITPTIGAPGRGNPRNRQFDLALIRMAAEGGIRMLAGTDYNGAGYPVHDYSGTNANVMDELAGLVEAGLTPLDALKTATVNPAIVTGMESQLGSVDPGKFADLLLLEGDPTADIANVKRFAAVVVNGKLIDAAEMKKMEADEMAKRDQEKSETIPETKTSRNNQ
jgi:imidazolonepropionase-like amidohydrolase